MKTICVDLSNGYLVAAKSFSTSMYTIKNLVGKLGINHKAHISCPNFNNIYFDLVGLSILKDGKFTDRVFLFDTHD